FPAAGLECDGVGDVVLVKHHVDHAPRAQVPGRQDQAVRTDVLEGDVLEPRQRVIRGRDQDRVELEDRVVVNIVGNLQHRADGEVGLVRAQHLHAVAAGDIVQLDADSRMAPGELLDGGGQDVQDGRFAGRDVEFALFEVAAALGKGVGERIDALYQRH